MTMLDQRPPPDFEVETAALSAVSSSSASAPLGARPGSAATHATTFTRNRQETALTFASGTEAANSPATRPVKPSSSSLQLSSHSLGGKLLGTLYTSTTDPSLFSFETVKRLNQEHLAQAPLNPLSAAGAVALQQQQHQHQEQQTHKQNPPPEPSTSATRLRSVDTVAKPEPSDSSSPASQLQASPRHTDGDPYLIRAPLSQLRRASAPDSGYPPLRSISTALPLKSPSNHPTSPRKRPRLHRRSLDEASLRRSATDNTIAKDDNNNMAATMSYGTPDFFGEFNRYGMNGKDDPFLSSLTNSRRPTLVPQTRELYLHPSQINSPNNTYTNNDDLSSYFDSNLSTCNPNANNASTAVGTDPEATITLPPMLTLEEIIQPHVFGHADQLEGPSAQKQLGTSTAHPSPNGQASTGCTLVNGMPMPSSYSYAPDYNQSNNRAWHEPTTLNEALRSRGSAYSSYYPPESHSDALFGTDLSIGQVYPSPGLHHAQSMHQLSFDNRVPLPPMPATSRSSPSAHSPSSRSRHLSPSRPSTRDGLMSQRSNTPLDTAPQKRSGKLPNKVTEILRGWLMNHTQHPYPTEEEKRTLCSQTNLTMNQVSNWFINARRRILPNLGNVAMNGNRKQLTHYNPPGPRRVYRPTGMPGYPPEMGAQYVPSDAPLAAARMRSHPYANYGPPPPIPGSMHAPMPNYPYGPAGGAY